MKRMLVPSISLACLLATSMVAHADHVPSEPVPSAGLALAVPALEAGDIRAITNVPAAQAPAAPLGETDPFTRGGRTYTITSSMWYGLQVLDVTNPLSPQIVGTYSSATTCASLAQTPASGGALIDPLGAQGGWENDLAFTPDGRIAIIGQDADGRCHDPASGGIELVDVSDVANPRLLHLVRNVGEAHSITIDPERPWLAYISTSDSNDLIDIVDFRSCLGGVAGIEQCRPAIARAAFDERFYPSIANPATEEDDDDLFADGCHDIRFEGDRAFCAAVFDGSLMFDTSQVVGPDGELTGTHLTAGEHACPTLEAEFSFAEGAMITDCLGWTEAAFDSRGAQPVDLPLVSWVSHHGGGPPDEDVQIAHQAEAIADGRIMFVTDERGGGITNTDGCPGGGAHFYDIRDEANPELMQLPDGSPAVYRTELNLPGTAHMSCTIHYGEEFADENLLVFGWYLNGWRVVRYDVDFTTSPATVSFEEVAGFTPAGGEVTQAKGLMRNPDDPDELIVYAADWFRGLDVMGAKVERITRADAFTTSSEDGSEVLGTRTQAKDDLPATGAGDPVAIALSLLVLALGVSTRVRRLTM